MSTIGKVLAAFLVILFTILTSVWLFAFNAERQLLSARTWKQLFQRENLYERLPLLVGQQMVESPSEENSLSPSEMQSLLVDLIDPVWLRTETESVIDQYFKFLNSNDPEPSIVVSLVPLKERLAGPQGARAMATVMNSWPECTPEEMGLWAQTLEGNIVDTPECKPPGGFGAETSDQMAAMVQDFASTIPDTVDLAQRDANTPNARPFPDPRPGIRNLRIVLFATPVVLIGLLGLIILCAVRSTGGLLRWWGVSLLAAGVVAGGLTLLAFVFEGGILISTVQEATTNQPALTDAVVSIVQAIANRILLWTGAESFALAVTGLIMLVIGLRMRPPAPAGTPTSAANMV
jgi:hypothetical protein